MSKLLRNQLGVEHLDSVSWHGIEILQQLLRKLKDGRALSNRVMLGFLFF